MSVYAINGSPRKERNTATMLEEACRGVKDSGYGGGVELVHLYDLEYTPCISCFGCKLLGGKHYGSCILKDELTPVLKNIAKADALILGSPIFFGSISAKMKGFLERLLFQYLEYSPGFPTLAPRKFPVGMIYTMNAPQAPSGGAVYEETLRIMEQAIEKTFSAPRVVYAFDTYQFGKYERYMTTAYSEPAKRRQHDKQFPLDRASAYELGRQLMKPLV